MVSLHIQIVASKQTTKSAFLFLTIWNLDRISEQSNKKRIEMILNWDKIFQISNENQTIWL
jgi:hypothetical protein